MVKSDSLHLITFKMFAQKHMLLCIFLRYIHFCLQFCLTFTNELRRSNVSVNGMPEKLFLSADGCPLPSSPGLPVLQGWRSSSPALASLPKGQSCAILILHLPGRRCWRNPEGQPRGAPKGLVPFRAPPEHFTRGFLSFPL